MIEPSPMKFCMIILTTIVLRIHVECKSLDDIVVARGDPFSFDCQQDESIFYARRLDDWSEIQEDNDNYLYLNLKFEYLNQEKRVRVYCTSAQSEHVGYYACRKTTWTSTSMNRVYQLILAGMHVFHRDQSNNT
jgi:hypothetical protein